MRTLTDRQREVLNFISQFTEDNVFPPTVREIGEHFNITLRAVQDHLAALQKKGYITMCQKRSRSIRVLKDDKQTGVSLYSIKVPLLNDFPHNRWISEEDKPNITGSVLCASPFVVPERILCRTHSRFKSEG